MTRKSRE